MREENKSKTELLKELSKLRSKVTEYERLEIEQIKGREDRQKSDEMYKALVKTSPDAIAVYDVNNCAIEVSDTWLKMWGFENADKVIGKNGFEFIVQEDHEKLKEYREVVLKKGYVKNIEMTFIKKDGTRFRGELNGSLIKDARGKTKAFMSVVRDITERKITEEALRESEEMYRTLVKTSPESIAVHSLESTILAVSDQWLNIWGYTSADEVIGRSSFEFVAPEDKKKAKKILQKSLEEGSVRNLELTFLRKDGTHFLGELNGTLIRDTTGKPKMFMVTSRDIKERKQSERELKKYRNHLEKLVENRTKELEKINEQLKNELIERKKAEERYKKLVITSPDPVAVHDLKGSVLEVSNKWLEMWRYDKADEVIGRNPFDFIAPESWGIARKNLSRVLKKGFTRTVEMTMLRKDGTRFIGELNGSMIEDASGKPIAIMATTRDITERKRMENALKESQKNLQKEVKTLRRQIHESKSYTKIIGNSSHILKVIDLIQQVARTDSTVLITGETGSGKDLIAQVIHSTSSRNNSPFIEVNCGALPEHLIESELFGYVKGAFTGALQNKMGLFEEANNGTIYLNEISDLPLLLQAKLLQVLEKQQIRRLGQSKSTKIDVRIIAASNINLDEAAKKGRFRQDLFYRLNIFPIKIPPLRERKEDIPLLARYLLNKHCSSLNKEITDISKDAMDILCSYDYPGNVRELENIMQRSIIIAQGRALLPQHLPEKMLMDKSFSAPITMADFEKQQIINTIIQCKGNLDHAAKKLDYSRTTLWRRMKKLNIKRPKYFS
jgi:two-component system response regulator PilR (NtrC family)/two-component system response regulator HydG